MDLLEGVEVVFGRACFQESSVERDYVLWFGHKIGEDEAAIDELDSFLVLVWRIDFGCVNQTTLQIGVLKNRNKKIPFVVFRF